MADGDSNEQPTIGNQTTALPSLHSLLPCDVSSDPDREAILLERDSAPGTTHKSRQRSTGGKYRGTAGMSPPQDLINMATVDVHFGRNPAFANIHTGQSAVGHVSLEEEQLSAAQLPTSSFCCVFVHSELTWQVSHHRFVFESLFPVEGHRMPNRAQDVLRKANVDSCSIENDVGGLTPCS